MLLKAFNRTLKSGRITHACQESRSGKVARHILFLITFLFLSGTSFAKDNRFQYGLVPVVSALSSDVDVETESKVAGNAFSAVVIMETGRNTRLWTQVQYQSVVFEGSTSTLGQDVTSLGLSMLYQSRYRWSRRIKPWFGFGMGLATERYRDRFITDDQGFLAERFEDTEHSNISIDVNATLDIDMFAKTETGFMVHVKQPIDEGLSAFAMGFYILF